MNPVRKAIAAAAVAGSLLTGGAIGATLFSAGGAGAATSTTTAPATSSATTPAATSTPAATPAPGHPNEDATHEAGESAAREAAEDNGTATYGPPAGSAGAPATGATATTPAA